MSVVIPVHNGATTIARAIDSAVRQSRPPLEIVVVDDASNDSTGEVVERIAATSTIPVRLLSMATNDGPATARNLGWDQARGDLVAFLDADDVWHPQKLEIQVPIMDESPVVVMSAHDHSFVRPADWPTIEPAHVVRRDLSFRNFLARNRCSTPSVIIRRSIPERFDPRLRRVEDYHLWLTIARVHGRVRYADVRLVSCTNPAYGGVGLSGNLSAMFRAEVRAMWLLTRDGHLPWPMFPMVFAWSTLKFVVRVVDHRFLADRLQTIKKIREPRTAHNSNR